MAARSSSDFVLANIQATPKTILRCPFFLTQTQTAPRASGTIPFPASFADGVYQGQSIKNRQVRLDRVLWRIFFNSSTRQATYQVYRFERVINHRLGKAAAVGCQWHNVPTTRLAE
jgi:hypothetical protein